MAILAITMTFLVYILLFKYLRLPFAVSNSAYTFPLVISATASAGTSLFLETQDISSVLLTTFQTISFVELIIATLMVFYVSFRYCLLLKVVPSLIPHDNC